MVQHRRLASEPVVVHADGTVGVAAEGGATDAPERLAVGHGGSPPVSRGPVKSPANAVSAERILRDYGHRPAHVKNPQPPPTPVPNRDLKRRLAGKCSVCQVTTQTVRFPNWRVTGGGNTGHQRLAEWRHVRRLIVSAVTSKQQDDQMQTAQTTSVGWAVKLSVATNQASSGIGSRISTRNCGRPVGSRSVTVIGSIPRLR